MSELILIANVAFLAWIFRILSKIRGEVDWVTEKQNTTDKKIHGVQEVTSRILARVNAHFEGVKERNEKLRQILAENAERYATLDNKIDALNQEVSTWGNVTSNDEASSIEATMNELRRIEENLLGGVLQLGVHLGCDFKTSEDGGTMFGPSEFQPKDEALTSQSHTAGT